MDKTDLNWIFEHISDQDLRLVSSLLPDQFDAYFKVFLPLAYAKDFPLADYRYEPDTVENLNKRLQIGKDFFDKTQWEKIKLERLTPFTYKALATLYDLPYGPTLTYRKIVRSIGSWPLNVQRHLSYEQQFIQELIAIFGKEEQALFYGQGGSYFSFAGQAFQEEWILADPFSTFEDLYLKLNQNRPSSFPLLPQYIADQKQKWAISSSKTLGADYLIIGLDESKAKLLRAHPNLEVIELKYTQFYIG